MVLGHIGPAAKDALPLIRKLADDADDRLRDAARKAVERIEGKR
jgi:HEAT repeat protein